LSVLTKYFTLKARFNRTIEKGHFLFFVHFSLKGRRYLVRGDIITEGFLSRRTLSYGVSVGATTQGDIHRFGVHQHSGRYQHRNDASNDVTDDVSNDVSD